MLSLILPALLIGYWTPAILMALPSPAVVSNDFQQWAVVSWNLFPLLALAAFGVLAAIASVFAPADATPPSPRAHLRAVRGVSAIALAISSAIHLGIVALSFASVLFPVLFNPEYAPELHPASLFVPPVAITWGHTVGDGVRSFFLWDQVFGYAIVAVVMLIQLRTAIAASARTSGWLTPLRWYGLASLVMGPGSACLALGWLRDEALFASESDDIPSGTRKRT